MADNEKSGVEENLTTSGIGLSTKSDDTMNEDTPVVVASAVKEIVTPSVLDMTVETKKRSSLEDTTVFGSFPPLSTQGTTTAGNAPGKSSYANVTCKPGGKKVNVRTLFTPGGNRIDVVVPVDSIRAISERFANTAYARLLDFSFQFSSMDGLDAMLENGPWFIWNNPLILKKCYPDENLLKEDGRSSYVRVMIELRVIVELKDNIVVAMPKITRKGHYTCDGEKKTVKKAYSSGNKKKGVEPTIEVCNSNTFDVLNSVNNDVEFGTNGGLLICSGTTPIIEKIGKFKDLLTSGQAILVDKVDNPLKKVEFSGEYDSEDEVASVDNDTARSMAYEKDLSHELQAICDNLDIRVRGRKKK
ncbi:hypothetical protein Tco_0781971 [Tanacetum coccineum]